MVRNRGMVLASFIAVVFALVAGVIGAPPSAHAIFVPTVNDDLAYLRSYATGAGAFPQAIAVSPFGDIYYTHSDYHMWDEVTYDNRVFGVTSDGFEFLNLGADDYSEFQWPDGLALTESGNLIVADTSDTGVLDHNRLRIFDAYDGTFIRNIGGFGAGPLGFNKPYGVTVADDGTIFVADTGNNRIQMVSESGSYIGSWPMPTGAGVNPNGMDFDPDGHLWVAMEGSNRVCEFTADGTLLRSITTWDETDAQGNVVSSETLYGPMDVAVDSYGVVYICDTNNSRVVRFDEEGTWLGTFNGYDTPETGLSYPTDVEVDAFGNVYVADALNDAIYKFQFIMADPDEVPPVTTSNIDEDWQQGPVGVTLTAEDASLTVEATMYSTDGSEPDTEYTGPFTVSAEGTTTIKYFSVDRAENYEQIQTEMVRIDNTMPVTTADYEPVGWSLYTNVALTATDALSGVYNTLYFVDNGAPMYYSGVPIRVFGTGPHTVDFYSFDNAGNAETFKRINLVLEAPDVTAPITSTNIPSGWINTSHSIEVTGTDSGGSGINHTYFSSDGSNPTTEYPGPLLVTDEGIRTLKYYSTDRAGNVEAVKTSQLKIDKTAPTSSSDGLESYVGSATINFQASDALSGVQDFVYRLDTGDWTRAYTISTSALGNHKVTWYATDQAGNQQTPQTLNFTILQPDDKPPITGDDIPPSWIKGPVSVSFNAHDVVSSVQGTYYSLDGSFPTVLYTGPFMVNVEGSHTVKYYSVDTRGNAENVHTKLLRIDNTPPVSSTNAQASYLGTAQITLSATDSLSAVASMRYRLDGGNWVDAMPGDKVTTSIVGSHLLEYYAVDTPSNSETIKSVNFTVTPPDTLPPVSTMTAPSAWVRGPATVTLSATDAHSTVSGIYYSLTGAPTPLSLYSSPLSVSAEGTTTITYRAVDFWGNWEATKSGTVRVDNTAPVTTTDASLNYVDQATVNLSSADALSGVNRTYYKLDTGAWQQGTSVYVTGYYYHTIQYYSVDNAGNTEGVKSTQFRINRADRYYDEDDALLLYRGTWSDRYSGATNASTDTNSDCVVYFQGDRFWFLAYEAPDAGIAQVSIDGGPWQNVDLYDQNYKSGQYAWYSGDLTYDYHMVRIRPSGLKNALSSNTYVNVDQVRVQGFVDEVPDTAAPTTTSNINENWQRGPVSVSLSAVDTTTGVAATYYSTDGGTPSTLYSGAFSINTDGQNIIKYYSTDKRGNTEVIKTQYVRVDNTAPVTTNAAITGFISAGSVALTPTDTNGSGVSATYWRLDGGSWSTGVSATIPYVVGNHLLEWYSVDAVGNTETVKSASVPVYARNEQTHGNLRFTNAWLAGESTSYSGGSYTYTINNGFADVAFTGTGIRWITTKGQSFGIARVTLDDNPPVLVDLYRGTNSHKQVVWTASGLSDDTVHRVRIEWTGTKHNAATNNYVGVDAIDVVGALVPVDLEAPVTNAIAPASWTKSPALVVLNPTDAVSGVVETTYVLDGGAQTPYTEPLAISGDGVHTVQYWSKDARGNTEATKSLDVYVDDTNPETSSDITEEWQHGPVSVTLTGDDALSGVSDITWTVDGSAPVQYTGPFDVVGDGDHTVTFFATDSAGNVEATTTQTVRIDDQAPESSSDVSSEWQTGPVPVTLSASDSHSGVTSTRYSIDGGGEQTYTDTFSVSGSGTHTVEYYSVDALGNTESVQTDTINIDDTAPVSTSDVSEAWQSGPVSVELSATDAHSGVNSITYSVDGGALEVYSEPFSVSGDGAHEVVFSSTDDVGNAETPQSVTLHLDNTAPTTATDAVATYPNTATIHLTATDTGAGDNTTYYRMDDGDWTSGTTATTTSIGAHTLYYYSVDSLGNTEATESCTFTVLARHEQDHALLRTTGTWTTASYPAYSAGSYAWTRQAGGKIDAAFEGTRVDVVATKGAAYGIMRITLDDDAPVDVDLYSPSTKYKSTVFSADSLAQGLHRLKIEFTGTKNALATNNYADLDAIDINGSLATVDLEAPTTTSDAPGTWVKGPLSLTLSATDAYAGVASTYVSLGAAAADIYSSPVVVSAEGTTVATFWSVDNRGNTETSKTATLRVDSSAPLTDCDISGSWQRGPVDVQLTATDSCSGVATTYYSIDGGAEQQYSGAFSVDGDGLHSVAFYSVDAVGNVEPTNTRTVRVDNTAPVVTSDAVDGWQVGPASVSLNATDALSDVSGIRYRIDDGDSADYTDPISVADEGTHTVTYWATDTAGNISSPEMATVRIDNTVPTSISDIAEDWKQGPVAVTLGSGDGLSGVDHTLYAIDGGAEQTYSGPFLVAGDGEHTVTYRSVDVAGNSELTNTKTVRVDDSAPVSSTDAPAGIVTADTTVNITASDPLSGVQMTEARVNGGSWVEASAVSFTEPGDHLIEYRSLDNVGNLETAKSASVQYQKRFEQTNASLRFTNTWLTASNVNYSGGSYTYGTRNGSRMDAAFTGTKVDLYSAKGSVFGIMRVTVDDRSPVDVDLYNATTQYKQKVFSLTGLSQGLHRLKVEYTGTKNPSASNSYVNVDAADFFGQLQPVDLEAPVTSSNASAGWVQGPVALEVSATDAVSGVAQTYLQVGDGASSAYNSPVSITAEGPTVASFWSIDNRGNRETTKTAQVRIDNTAPVTSSDTTSTWSRGPVNVTLAATDPLSGIAQTYYTIDGGTQQVYSGAFPVTGDGAHTIAFHSVDAAGNAEAAQTRTVRVDDTAPSTTASPATVYSESASVSLSAADTASGVARTYWRIDAGSWSEGGTASTSTPGTHLLEFYSVDTAGNSEPIRSATLHVMHRNDQTAADVYYEGKWLTGSVASYHNGSYSYLASTGFAEFTMQGTRFDWIATKGKTFGIARVSVDGGAPVDVDLYAASTLYKQSVFSTGVLANGTHTIRIEWTGTKNALATGNYVNIDALDIVGGFGAKRFEQTDGLLYFNGKWFDGSTAYYSGGSYKYVSAPGEVTVSFEGQRAEWIATKGKIFGIAKVTIDGGTPTYVDLYASATQYKQMVFSTQSLTPGAHTLKIEWTGTKNDAATNNYLNVDAIDVVGKLIGVRYEQNSEKVYLHGTWANLDSSSLSGGSYSYLSSAGAAHITFDGSRFDLLATKGPIFGIASVSIDGGTPVMIDLYAGTNQHKQKVFSVADLPLGTHDLVVRYTGTKNPSASSAYINLDAFDLVGRPIAKRFEQNNASVYSSGSWLNLESTSLSDGSYAYLSGAGYRAIEFEGTKADLIAMKGQLFGIAKVTIDGGEPTLVDLYSPTSLYKQTVFSTGSLSPGSHTMTIEWTGTKNPAATSDYINVDAIDVVGFLGTYDPAPKPTHFEENVAGISFDGGWRTASADSFSGGTYRYASDFATATVGFSGTEVTWIGTKGPVFGIAEVSVDGGAFQPVDLYAAANKHRQTLFSASGLSQGNHTLVIRWTGTKNALASQNYVNLDAIEVLGTLLP